MDDAIPPDALCHCCGKPGCDVAAGLFSHEDVFARLSAKARGDDLEIAPCGAIYYHAVCLAAERAVFAAWVEAERTRSAL